MNIVERAHFLIDCLNDESYTTTKDDLAEVSDELDEIIEKLIDAKIYQKDEMEKMAVYECEECGFKTDEFEFMKVHHQLSPKHKMVMEKLNND
jgi:hypothetical protein